MAIRINDPYHNAGKACLGGGKNTPKTGTSAEAIERTRIKMDLKLAQWNTSGIGKNENYEPGKHWANKQTLLNEKYINGVDHCWSEPGGILLT